MSPWEKLTIVNFGCYKIEDNENYNKRIIIFDMIWSSDLYIEKNNIKTRNLLRE